MGAQCTSVPAEVAHEQCFCGGDDERHSKTTSSHSSVVDSAMKSKSLQSAGPEESSDCGVDEPAPEPEVDEGEFDERRGKTTTGVNHTAIPNEDYEHDAVARASRILQEEGDVLQARIILAKLQATLQARPGGMEAWKVIVNAPSFVQFFGKLGQLQEIGRACCRDSDDWVSAYKNSSGDLQFCFDPSKPYQAQYRLHLVFPVKLTNAFAIGNEIELAPLWNSFLSGAPEVLSRTKSMDMVVASKASALGGMIKNDSLDAIQRYVDEEAGVVAEIISTVGEGHPLFRKPSRGYKRMENTIRSVWAACGPEHSVLWQSGNLALPFQCSKRLLMTLGGLVGKYLLASLIRNAMRSTEPGSPWEDALAKDVHGFYVRLDRCVSSEASQRRRLASGSVTCDAAEICSFLDRHQMRAAPESEAAMR